MFTCTCILLFFSNKLLSWYFFNYVTNNYKFFVLFFFRELLDQHPENIRMIMTHTIYNELSNTKNPNNMAIITTLFQKNGEQSARVGI